MKQTFISNLKNILGASTKRKLVIFSIDDYGNIRLDSAEALKHLKNDGVQPKDRFDEFDALETTEDLEHLFDVLRSVKDKNKRHAVFTPYALPCNINFQKTLEERAYVPETLPQTWKRLQNEQPKAYNGIENILQQGIKEQIFIPQFHGREHVNINLLNRHLAAGDSTVTTNLKNKSLIAVSKRKDMPDVGFNQSFAFWDTAETKAHREILTDGLQKFKDVYGYATTAFTPPAQQLHPELYSFLEAGGVQAIDKPLFTKRHLGFGKFKNEFNTLGKHSGQNHLTLVRNVLFEPNNGNKDHVGTALKQIEAAFRWGKPANISSHRVNYCGHIEPQNRKQSLTQLKELLKRISKRWPDVEFLSIDELIKEMVNSNAKN